MSFITRSAVSSAVSLTLALTLSAQRQPGRPIGKVNVIGNLIHIEVDSGALRTEHLFDLDHRTLRFTPEGSGYRVENLPLRWDADFGSAVQGTATLKGFRFPFSGETWDTFNVATGSITFGGPIPNGRVPTSTAAGNRAGGAGGGRGGFTMERYAFMQTVGSTFINMAAGIAAYVKPGLNGQRFMKELPDRAVVTWTLTEPSGGIQAFSWTPTVNRIQAVLHRDGAIELSYNDVNARDGVVGVFPAVTGTQRAELASFLIPRDQTIPEQLDLGGLKLEVVDGLFLEATLNLRGPITADGGGVYRIAFDTHRPAVTDAAAATVVWTLRPQGAGRRGGAGAGGGAAAAAVPGASGARYAASGPGVNAEVIVDGSRLTVRGVLPTALSRPTEISVLADASPTAAAGAPLVPTDRFAPRTVTLRGINAPEMDLSSVTKASGPFRLVYEGFAWSEIPRSTDVTCTVIRALGDRFDFLVSYSDFRVDNPEGGTPSTGPRGGNVSGIGTSTNNTEAFCSQGRFQWMYAQPVSMAAIQSMESAPDGRMTNYNYAMSQVGHELGHRWAADASAIVNGERIALGPVHWATGVHLPAAFPFSKPVESDAMGGGVWKDNGDGTFAQIDDDYYAPANGFSWFALYLMGLARPDEVPDFFILRNLQRTGQRSAEGHPLYTGTRTNITIKDVLAAMGPRQPDFATSQRAFTTAMVIMTLPGQRPSPELIARTNAIGDHWVSYWSKVTGGRSTMSIAPR